MRKNSFQRAGRLSTGLLTAVVAGALLWVPNASAYRLIEITTSTDRYTGWIGPDLPVEWRLNEDINDNSITNEFEILRASWDAWTTLPGMDFEVVEGPNTTFCGLQQNGVNTLSMEDCFGQCTGSCLAVTSTVIYNVGDGFWSTGTVSDSIMLARQESDITWSATRNWEDYRDWPPCPNGSFDLWGVSIHEMGHFLGLDHSQFGPATMFASVAPCDASKATLYFDDAQGARSIYGSDTRVGATTLNAGNASLSVTNKGNLGFTGSGGRIGDSFTWGGTGVAEHIFECSAAFAEAGGPVSDNFRTASGTDPGGDADLQQSGVLLIDVPGDVVAEEASGMFTDVRAESPYDIEVTCNYYADDATENEDFVIAEYIIENTGGSTLEDYRAGLFIDVDFNNQFGSNSVNYDAANSLAYVSTPNTTNLFGVTVCNAEGAAAMRALFATDTGATEDWTDGNKSDWMGGAFSRTTLGPADIALMIATGDFTIAPGGTACAAFAILGGSSLADLQANAQAAQDLYQNTIKLDPVDVSDGTPVLPIAALGNNSPNPFSNATRLEYTLLSEGPVSLDVIDASGRQIRSLVNETQTKGVYSLVWDGRDEGGQTLPSGVYFTRLRIDGREETKKMHMLR